jgi:hypothetical protein
MSLQSGPPKGGRCCAPPRDHWQAPCANLARFQTEQRRKLASARQERQQLGINSTVFPRSTVTPPPIRPGAPRQSTQLSIHQSRLPEIFLQLLNPAPQRFQMVLHFFFRLSRAQSILDPIKQVINRDLLPRFRGNHERIHLRVSICKCVQRD